MFDLSGVGILAAAAAGAVSFLSPCVLPLVPGYLSYIAGSTPEAMRSARGLRGRGPILLLSLCFVLGFSTVFVALGAGATAVGRLLMMHRYEAGVVSGAVIVVFGVMMTGLLRPAWLQRDVRFHGAIPGGRPAGAYLLGLAFGFGWTPCIGPILGSILAVAALSSTAAQGMALLGVYSAGLAVPFLLAALFTEALARRMARMRMAGRALRLAGGGVMVAMGVAMITGHMTSLSFWLLERFPVFLQVG